MSTIKKFDAFINEGKKWYAKDRWSDGKQFNLFQQTDDLFKAEQKLIKDCENFIVNFILSHGSKVTFNKTFTIYEYNLTDRWHKDFRSIQKIEFNTLKVKKDSRDRDYIVWENANEDKGIFSFKSMDLKWVLEFIEYLENITDKDMSDEISKVEL